MVLLFKGIAPPSQFPATIASGAPPGPNHACLQNPLEEQGGGGCLHHAYCAFPKKKLSPCTTCPQHAHVHEWHIVCEPRRAPFMGCSSSGSRNIGDGSGGDEGGKERKPNGACPRDDQSSHRHRWIHRLSEALSPFWPQEERLTTSGLLLPSRWTSTAVSDENLPL